MPKLTFIDTDGTARTIEAETGLTVMENAIQNDIPGILATCGVVGDVIEVATPPLSMSSMVFWIDQFFSGKSARPITSIAANQVGGTMW